MITFESLGSPIGMEANDFCACFLRRLDPEESYMFTLFQNFE